MKQLVHVAQEQAVLAQLAGIVQQRVVTLVYRVQVPLQQLVTPQKVVVLEAFQDMTVLLQPKSLQIDH
jgi:hypothetical protein